MDNHKPIVFQFNETEFIKRYRPYLTGILLFALLVALFFSWYILNTLPEVHQISAFNQTVWLQAWFFLFFCFETGLVGGSLYVYLGYKKRMKRSYITLSDSEMIYFQVKAIVPKWQMQLMWRFVRKDYFEKEEYFHFEKIFIGKIAQVHKNKLHILIVTGALQYEETIEMDLDLSDPMIVKKGQKTKSGCRIPPVFDQMDKIEQILTDFSRK